MNAAALISRFQTGTYTVTRRAAATYVAGRVVAGATSTFTITASIQSASGRDLLRLPEGRRSTDTQVVYTTTELKCGSQANANESDQVTIDGALWEVQHIEAWPTGSYYRAIVQAPS